MTGIVNYGMGNLRSVWNAFDMIGAEARILEHPSEVKDADRVIVPGVGAFRDCIHLLRTRGFADALREHVEVRQKPVLGVCVGMQVMARKGFEFGEHDGLGWINGEVMSLQTIDPALPVPHVGWNNVKYEKKESLFSRLPVSPEFYFVHSFYMKVNDSSQVIATAQYGADFPVAIHKDNIYAVQFHPEKSQDYGLTLLENFLKI